MKGHHILLIDDDAIVLSGFRKLLELKGYRVTTATDPEEGLQTLKGGEVDLVITDLITGGMDGITILRKAKRLNPTTAVIILTGYGDLNSAIDAIRLDANDYILKPCDAEELYFRVDRCFKDLELKRKIVTGHMELEERVMGRTLELARINEELEAKTTNLKEVNTALRVLLKERDDDREELEEKMLFNLKELVTPYIEKLKRSRMEEKQKACVDIMESNLNDIISPFVHGLSTRFLKLTPSEIQVANLVKLGKTTKEIAELSNLSPRTIESHRDNIRKKVGIKNKRVNLRTFLLSS